MQVSYKLSLSDYLAAQHLYYWRKFSAKMILILNYVIYPLLGLIGLALYAYSVIYHHGKPWSAGFFGGIFVLLFIPLWFQFNLRRCYKKGRVIDANCNLDFNEENIQTDIPGYAKSTFEWQAVHNYQEGKKTILVYVAQTRFFVIPKHVLAPGQRDEFITLLQRKISPKKI